MTSRQTARFLRFACIGALLTLPAVPRAGTHTENFATHQFEDTLATTADWDTTTQTLGVPHLIPSGPTALLTSTGTHRVIVDGVNLYLAQSNQVEIRDPWAFPSLRAQITYDPLTFPVVKDIALDGNILVVALQTQTGIFPPVYHYDLHAYDVTDASFPASVAVKSLAGLPTSVTVKDGTAWATVGGDVVAVDLFGSAANTTVVTPGTAAGVDVEGNFLYVGDGTALRVYDVSVPMFPSARGAISPSGYTQLAAVDVDGNVVFVASGSDGFVGISAADPDFPILQLSSAPPFGSGPVHRVTIDGDIVTIAQGSRARKWEIALGVAGAFREVGAYAGTDIRDAVTSGRRLFTADVTEGATKSTAANVVSPTDVSDVSVAPLLSTLYDVAVSGDYAYINIGCLAIYDISDPSNPAWVSSLGCPPTGGGPLRAFAVDGSFVYAASNSEFSVIDVSSRPAPVTVGTVPSAGTPGEITVHRGRAYVSDGTGFRAFDVTSPSFPSLVSTVTAAGAVTQIRASGDYLYAVASGVGLRVIDGDPASATYLQVLGTVSAPTITAVALDGDRAWITQTGSPGDALYPVDIGNPAAPTLGSGWPVNPSISTSSMSRSGGVLWLGGTDAIVAMAIHESPVTEVVRYNLPGLSTRAGSLTATGDMLYFARHGIVESFSAKRVLGRDLDPSANEAQSTVLYDGPLPVTAVRVTPNATRGEQITWSVQTRRTGSPHPVTADGAWHAVSSEFVDTLGARVRWNAVLDVQTGRGAPSVSDVTVDWRHPTGRITGIDDVPADQGGWLNVTFDASANDGTGISPSVASYTLYRQPGAWRGVSTTWDSVTSITPTGQNAYTVLVSTPYDSTLYDGPRPWRYFVRAWTDSAGYFLDTPVDSGYSIDNIPLVKIANVTADYNTVFGGNRLSWTPNEEPDFFVYRIYRGTSPGFQVSPATFVDSISVAPLSSWTDFAFNGWSVYYAITAVDQAGNENDAAYPGVTTGAGDTPVPDRWWLAQNVPNPFNPSTSIPYAVPAGGGNIRIAVYDAAGRRVRTLLDGRAAPGVHTAFWNGRNDRGARVSSGVYFLRMKAGSFVATRKMTLVE